MSDEAKRECGSCGEPLPPPDEMNGTWCGNSDCMYGPDPEESELEIEEVPPKEPSDAMLDSWDEVDSDELESVEDTDA